MPAPVTDPVVPSSRREILICAAALAVGTLAAYHNTFAVPLLFDDGPAIADNRSILHLWPIWKVLNPEVGHGVTVGGRPVLNLSLALCYAVGGADVWTHHALNLLIHVGAALALFGVVRRTLRFHCGPAPAAAERSGRIPLGDAKSATSGLSAGALTAGSAALQSNATPIAFTIALLWALHPLQTESVTYIIQRTESLMGLFFLLTFYGFIRAVESPRPRGWQIFTVAACLLGVGTKEVAVAAPVLVLLYDRTFVAGTFRDAWRRRRWLHLALAATWMPLLWLVAGTGWNRGGTAGFNVGISPWSYWFTQFEAVARYVKLSFWPHPLVFAYRTFWAGPADAAPYALVVVPLAVATLVALWRRPAIGFLGAWFFVILAPTSLMPGTIQMIVEHRMYLPLAAVITLAVGASVTLVGRRSLPAFLALAVAAGALTERRNQAYCSDLSLWGDTAASCPESVTARSSFGIALYERGRLQEALSHLEFALRLNPSVAKAHYNLGLALLKLNRQTEAAAQFEQAVRLLPTMAEAQYEWGVAYYQLERMPEAVACFQRALRENPCLTDAHFSLGLALFKMGRSDEALAQYTEAARLDPDRAEIQCNLGVALAKAGRGAEALASLQEAVRLDPAYAAAHCNLGLVLVGLGRPEAAIPHYRRALRLNPDYADAQRALGVALCQLNRVPEAVGCFRRALVLSPDRADIHLYLGSALAQMGELSEALEYLRQTVKLDPGLSEAHCNLASALAESGRTEEAVAEFQVALRLRPDYAEAHCNMGNALITLHRLPEARGHFEEALRIDPHFDPARQMLDRLRALPDAP